MDLTDAVLLGLVQGLTEFLPVSSSGHLVLAQALLGIESEGVALEVGVHLGTLASVLVYFRRDVFQILRDVLLGGPKRLLGWLVVTGTVPVAVLFVLAKPLLKALADSPVAAACGLIATGVMLLTTRVVSAPVDPVGVRSSLLVGCAQAVAVLPGVSRSGSTIAAGLHLGLSPEEAARFSFLLAIPAILGAGVVTAGDGLGGIEATTLLAAAGVAFASGLVAVHVLMRVVVTGRLAWFSPYCLAVGTAALVWLGLR